jgi:hypothetical protein
MIMPCTFLDSSSCQFWGYFDVSIELPAVWSVARDLANQLLVYSGVLDPLILEQVHPPPSRSLRRTVMQRAVCCLSKVFIFSELVSFFSSQRFALQFDPRAPAVSLSIMASATVGTIRKHMPLNHQHTSDAKGWTREELLAKATGVGTSTAGVAEQILSNSIYIEQNYKACFGMLMLEKRYGSQRLEAACALALTGTRCNYTMIKNILAAGMDKQLSGKVEQPLPAHDNIRGGQHYQ